MCVVFYQVWDLVDTAPWSLSAPPRVEVVSGLVGQDNFVPTRRFREDDLEDIKMSPGGGALDILLAPPPWQKKTKRIRSVRPKPNAALQILEAMWHALCFTHVFYPNTARGGRFHSVLVCS